MSLYNEVKTTIQDLDIGHIVTIDRPIKLKAFRKFLSEIAKAEHKKFTTKISGNDLHIMRVKYFSIAQTLQPE